MALPALGKQSQPSITTMDSKCYKIMVIVTGGNQGIGLDIFKKLSAEDRDYHIIMSGRRTRHSGRSSHQAQALDSSVEPLLLDMRSDDSISPPSKLSAPPIAASTF
jgi:NADP-dependent 3-hydroxy acid dehydrogenase YdfG